MTECVYSAWRYPAYDAAGGVGGTWYWNRYPGAKFDSESYIYQYLFSEKLYMGWHWSERFPGQPEKERWMNHVADELVLKNDIQFDTRIDSARYDETANATLISKTDSWYMGSNIPGKPRRMLS